jgi:hypothetical protein
MAPAILVDVGAEAFRHARCLVVIRLIASPTRCAGGAAATRVGAFPRA